MESEKKKLRRKLANLRKSLVRTEERGTQIKEEEKNLKAQLRKGAVDRLIKAIEKEVENYGDKSIVSDIIYHFAGQSALCSCPPTEPSQIPNPSYPRAVAVVPVNEDTKKKYEEMGEAMRNGLTNLATAERFKVSISTVMNVRRFYGLTRKNCRMSDETKQAIINAIKENNESVSQIASRFGVGYMSVHLIKSNIQEAAKTEVASAS